MIRARTVTTLRLHRFELIAFTMAFAVFAGGLFLASIWVASLTPPLACFPGVDGSLAGSAVGCDAPMRAFQGAQGKAFALTAPLLAITYAVGLFLGVPIVARQAERGTTRLAWSLAPSRWRWYVSAIVPIAIVLLVLAFAGGTALDRYFEASQPSEDVGASFTGFAARGGLMLAGRAFVIFGIGVALGAIIGRSWPALIVGAVVATILLGGGQGLEQDVVLRSEAVLVDASDPGGAARGDLYIDTQFRLPDGRYVGWDSLPSDAYDLDGNPRYPMFSLVVPGERYRFVEAREAAVLFLGGLAAIGIGGLAVSRRRPG